MKLTPVKILSLASASVIALTAWTVPAEAQVPAAPTISVARTADRATYTYNIQPGQTGMSIHEATDANFTIGVTVIGAPVTQTTYGFPHACATYYFRARARNASGDSPFSPVQRTDCPCILSSAPVLTARQTVAGTCSSGIDVAWTYPALPAVCPAPNHTINKTSNAGENIMNGVGAVMAGHYSAIAGVTYTFKVVANGVGNSSPWSSPVSVYCPGPTPIPPTATVTPTPVPAVTSAPAAPTISVARTADRATYTYNIQPGQTGMSIHEATDANFTIGVTVIGAPVNQTTYGFPHACATYYFRARARNASGDSPFSAVQRTDCPAAPTAAASSASPTSTPAVTSGWTPTSYQASDIAAGANGSVWFIAGGGSIYQVTSAGPQVVGGAATRVALDPSGVAWVVNSSRQIYKYSGGWVLQTGSAIDIGAGGDKIWILNSAGSPAYWNGTGWTTIAGTAVKISVDPSGNPWVVNSGTNIYRWNGTGWQMLPGNAQDIGVGADGAVYIAGMVAGTGGYQVSHWDAATSTWVAEPGVFGTAVAAGPAGRAYAARAGYPVLSR